MRSCLRTSPDLIGCDFYEYRLERGGPWEEEAIPCHRDLRLGRKRGERVVQSRRREGGGRSPHKLPVLVYLLGYLLESLRESHYDRPVRTPVLRPYAGAGVHGGQKPAGPLPALTAAGTDSEPSNSCAPPRAVEELTAVPRGASEMGTEASGAVLGAGGAVQAEWEGCRAPPRVA